MKHLFIFLAAFLFVGMANAQTTTVDQSLEPNYTHELFFDFSTNTGSSSPVNAWDIAFLRNSSYAFATRINDGAGIEVYQASNDPADWANIDITNIGSWTQLYNSDTTWAIGAFDQGTATYGWGEYNPVSHHVEGTAIFVLKYANGSFKKFMIEDFSSGYTFKYADWNTGTSSWEADETYTLPNSNNPNNLFNYFSLTTDSEVNVAPPTNDWDVVFRKYVTDLGGTMYPVSGVLSNPNISVAENIEPNGNGDTSDLSYSADINAIGYDWKSYGSGGYTIDTDTYFYLKNEDGTIYRVHFLSFEGSATGNLSFEYKNVTDQMGTIGFGSENSFSVFPNPSSDKHIQILYENNLKNGQGAVSLFSLTGKKVFEAKLKNNGFYNQTLDLSKLSSGVYLLKFQSGEFTTTKKIILN